MSGAQKKLQRKRAVYSIFSGRCFYCFKQLECEDRDTTQDHVIPRSIGGPNSWRNMVLACRLCNTERGSISAARYLQEHCDFLTWEICIRIMATHDNRLLFHGLRLAEMEKLPG